ncbi:MAG: WYL domain-containing transcriptional regulator [Clostridia bacterium]|nr:WYL domain-containing transcriptional regulator [Clostridia bacterium]
MEKSITKLKLLKLWEMLCQETDEDNPMPSTTIIKRLAEIGIPCDRRTLYKDIEALRENGYEVECNRSRQNEYYVLERNFEPTELHILIDAVQAASFITEEKTKDLVNRIATLSGDRKAEVLKSNAVAFNIVKNTNKMIYYSVNEIITAIDKKKKIEFFYFDYDVSHQKVYRKDKRKYIVNPYATIFSNDSYYLLCYDDKHEGMSHYRIDRMDTVRITDEPITKRPELKTFNVKKHKKQVFNMFAGEDTTVTIRIDKCLIDAMYDKFGPTLKMKMISDQEAEFTTDVQISSAFIGWCISFGDKLKVLSPTKVVEKIKESIEEIKKMYN